MTALAHGNTNTCAFRSRAFLFTLNQIEKYKNFIEEFKKLKTMDYFISCKEKAPTTGHEHIHLYVHFSQTYKLNKKILSYGSHIDICKGSPKQNIDYVSKDGDIIEEYGIRPSQGARTVKDLKEMDVNDCPPQYYNIKNKIDEKERNETEFFNMLDEIRNDELKAPEVIYITGGTGLGKTYTAYKEATRTYENKDIGKLTIENNFIDITNDKAKCFVIEEFRPSQIKASSFLQLTDKYGYKCNIKGGFQFIRPEKLIICSIKKPEEIYIDEEINGQFLRRITQRIDLDKIQQKKDVFNHDYTNEIEELFEELDEE